MKYADIRPPDCRRGRPAARRDHIDLIVMVGSEPATIDGVNRHRRRRLRWARLTGWLGGLWRAVPW